MLFRGIEILKRINHYITTTSTLQTRKLISKAIQKKPICFTSLYEIHIYLAEL